MSKYKIITDSGCDITKEDELRYKIDIMPFQIVIGNMTLWERVDLTPQEYYNILLTSEDMPKTSQITPMRFEEKFRECYTENYDDVIVVLINSTGSKTYENALLAKKNLEDEIPDFAVKTKIHIVDSHTYSLGYGYPIIEAAKKLENDQNISTVLAYLEDWFNCLEVYIIGFGLRHMKKSGRISAAAAFLGELMGLKPVISLIDGESKVLCKSRGDKKAIADGVKVMYEARTPETPWQLLRTTVTENEDEFLHLFTKKTGEKPSMISYSGGAVSSNAGPEMIGVLIKGKPRR